MVFMDLWVRMDGNTKFHMTFVFNRKRNAMELVINQVAANQICWGARKYPGLGHTIKEVYQKPISIVKFLFFNIVRISKQYGHLLDNLQQNLRWDRTLPIGPGGNLDKLHWRRLKWPKFAVFSSTDSMESTSWSTEMKCCSEPSSLFGNMLEICQELQGNSWIFSPKSNFSTD